MAPLDSIIFARECLANGQARKIRETAGLSRQALAQELGVSLGALIKWERGTATPADTNAERYGALLHRLQQHTNQPIESETA